MQQTIYWSPAQVAFFGLPGSLTCPWTVAGQIAPHLSCPQQELAPALAVAGENLGNVSRRPQPTTSTGTAAQHGLLLVVSTSGLQQGAPSHASAPDLAMTIEVRTAGPHRRTKSHPLQ
jgi:hypothetical protein